jgi:glycine/D-amino acid oxidase-like deaminating enzyme
MRIVIVGAGVVGASAAFHLARSGANVTVIDAQRDGRATAAGAGILCPWLSGSNDTDFYRLYAAGAAYYPNLVNILAEAEETDLGYRRCGALLVSADAGELDWTERLALRSQTHAPAMGAVTRLSPPETRALFPPLRGDLGAIFIDGGARVDGRRLAAALLRAARHHGATVVQAHATVLADGRRVGGAEAGGVRYDADAVIVCAGAWATELLRPLQAHRPVQPQRGQIVHMRLEEADTAGWPIILPPSNHYLVPFEDGRVVAGATRETGSGFDYRVTAGGQAEVLAEALKIAPGLGAATLMETRVGFRPVGPSVLPLLGWVPEVDGLAVGNGLGAAGLTIGPLAGRLLADLVTGQPRQIDLAPFDPAGRQGAPAEGAAALR